MAYLRAVEAPKAASSAPPIKTTHKIRTYVRLTVKSNRIAYEALKTSKDESSKTLNMPSSDQSESSKPKVQPWKAVWPGKAPNSKQREKRALSPCGGHDGQYGFNDKGERVAPDSTNERVGGTRA
jgi:hypothetical protein